MSLCAVIIDPPQAVDAAGNNHASRMLLRDVANLTDLFERKAGTVDLGSVMREIDDARADEEARRLRVRGPTAAWVQSDYSRVLVTTAKGGDQ